MSAAGVGATLAAALAFWLCMRLACRAIYWDMRRPVNLLSTRQALFSLSLFLGVCFAAAAATLGTFALTYYTLSG